MALGIDTALEHIAKLEKEIEDLAKEILEDTALTNARQALEALEKTSKEFTFITQKKKLDKLAKDIAKYDKSSTYPYLDEDYYKQDQTGKFVNRGRGGYRRYNYVKYNLSYEENLALKKKHDIAIKAADKGGGIVLQDLKDYKHEILSQLSDKNCYREIGSDPMK
ncbi:hypothetical protein NDU88_007009 [Pleurodeles waltl]|uniref:Uncharacterized protein n=1 Tax=Pleurodeles waltl TaxID=8319 RepID=A0AAV7PN23_PLEWA|nr:hypothetical protein NDU88_007009 [Pleurodeles waltl]